MLESINLHQKLIKERKKVIQPEDIIGWVYSVFKEADVKSSSVLERLSASPIHRNLNNFNIDKIDTNAIFHISQIEKICIDYRLRFLDTKYFKGKYPNKVLEKIVEIENRHETVLDGFKIIAPSKLFHLDKADDPLLFAPMENGYYHLIYKWGTDLHPLRKLKYWTVKNWENLLITVLVLSILFTGISKDFIYHQTPDAGHLFLLFLFYIKGFLGMFLLYGVASGKNFSAYCWTSRYDKIT